MDMEADVSMRTSCEDYLEAVLVLQKEKGYVRSIDLAHHMGYSRPSISRAVKRLQEESFLKIDGDGVLHLTDTGCGVAEKIFERHHFFTQVLTEMGVDPKLAEADACRVEHAISDESFERIKAAYARAHYAEHTAIEKENL